MLDGAAKIAPMLAEAQRLEMPAIGMTDHGNMFGASEFYNLATVARIKPIIGVEAYIAPGSRFDTRRILWGDPGQKADDVSGSGSYTHLTMVAENATGVRNLFRLSSLASFEGQLGKWSRMDAEMVAEHAAGIIATTGCPSGEVQTRLRLGHDPSLSPRARLAARAALVRSLMSSRSYCAKFTRFIAIMRPTAVVGQHQGPARPVTTLALAQLR